MVAVLVGDDVHLRERTALRAEPRLELVVEAEIDVDRLVQRAVERPDRARRAAAGGVDCFAEDLDTRLLELTLVGVGFGPVGVQALDRTEQTAVLPGVRVRAGLALADRLAADRTLAQSASQAGQVAEITAEEQDDGDEDKAAQPAAHREASSADTASTAVPDSTRIEVNIPSKGHVVRTPRRLIIRLVAERPLPHP